MEKKKILIIDDEKDFCEMVKLNLEDSGEYEVMAETNGIDAVNTARKFKPDLIFLDVVMPDVDGGDVAYQLGSDRMLKNTPIIFLTAVVRKDEVDSQQGIIGGKPFIAKPVTTKQLIDCIKKTIG